MNKPALTALRDVNIRFENGTVIEMWCVLPEDEHYDAVEQLAALGHQIELSRSGEHFTNPYTHYLFGEKIVGEEFVLVTCSDDEPHTDLSTGFATDWKAASDGRMLILVNATRGTKEKS